MINWFDMPAEGLSNGGLFEVKELEVTENGTYETKGEMYNKVVVNVEGGGGSWQTVFEGSVTTEDLGDSAPNGLIEDISEISADSIKVTFGGTEYTCEKQTDPNGNVIYGAPRDNETGEFDFSEYPFDIDSGHGVALWTPTAGTYTLKIEEEQSGGGDFSTAEVTMVYPAGVTNATVNGAFCFSMDGMDASIATVTTSGVYDMILYKGGGIVEFILGTGRSVTVTGNAEDLGGDAYLITGDCTITIS